MPRPLAHPFRPLTPAEQQALDQMLRAPSQPRRRHHRAQALLAVAAGRTLTAAAAAVGGRVGDTVATLLRRCNRRGLAARADQPRAGRRPTSTAADRERRVREVRRRPDRAHEGTAPWSLATLQRAGRRAPDGVPPSSPCTLLPVLHNAGYTGQRPRPGCETGGALRTRQPGGDRGADPHTAPTKELSARASRGGEARGLPGWGADAAGPYQPLPPPGASWPPTGHPARPPQEDGRGGTATVLTLFRLFRPATGAGRGAAVEQPPKAIWPPWLKRELAAIVAACPPAPAPPAGGCRGVDGDWQPGAEHLERFVPPLRVREGLDNLSGHCGRSFGAWGLRRGSGLLCTPLSGSGLTMAEAVQRIIVRRALAGQHPPATATLKTGLQDTVAGWKRAPTPFLWGGKRQARRARA